MCQFCTNRLFCRHGVYRPVKETKSVKKKKNCYEVVNSIRKVRKTSHREVTLSELIIESHFQMQTHMHPQSGPQIPALHSSLKEDRLRKDQQREGAEQM